LRRFLDEQMQSSDHVQNLSAANGKRDGFYRILLSGLPRKWDVAHDFEEFKE
jgi:hypothetical protein